MSKDVRIPKIKRTPEPRRQTLKDLTPPRAAAERIKGGMSRVVNPEDGSRYCPAIC